MYQYPKCFLSISQLIKKLNDAGMQIDSLDEAERALKTIGYYRLKGYSFHLVDRKTKIYKKGTKFSDVLRLYNFDSELSHLIFNYLSQIEVALRARLVNAFYITGDALILNDPSAFNKKDKYWQNQGAIASEISRSNDVFIKHNFNNHEGAIPIWASVEIMSFGTISKTIKNMKTGDKSAFSVLIEDYKYKKSDGREIKPKKDMFTSWIKAVSDVRNICAHNGRLYNRAINTTPEIISYDVVTPRPKYTGIYQIILSMKYLRPTDESWNDFVDDLNQLLNKYTGVYEFERMNFPTDWKNHFKLL